MLSPSKLISKTSTSKSPALLRMFLLQPPAAKVLSCSRSLAELVPLLAATGCKPQCTQPQ